MFPPFFFKKLVILGDGQPEQIFANYGAGFPVVTYAIVDRSDGWLEIVDADQNTQFIREEEVRRNRPASGSPIGFYWEAKHAI